MATYYELLGVGASVDDGQIKTAYRKLAIQLHPDKNPDKDTGPQFTEVTKAYETLRDPVLRQQYDQSLLAPKPAPGMAPGAPRGFSTDFAKSMNLGEALGKFFENLGHGDFNFTPEGSTEQASRRGHDIVISLKVTPQEVIAGGSRKIKFKRSIVCPACHGQGTPGGASPSLCSSCNGLARKEVEELVRIEIPKGVGKGNFIERAGQGHAGVFGGPSGNLVIGFEDEFPKGYERDGADLTREVPVDFFMMILGAAIPSRIWMEKTRPSKCLPVRRRNKKSFCRGEASPGTGARVVVISIWNSCPLCR
jgi:molecular chaperone DnaJ